MKEHHVFFLQNEEYCRLLILLEQILLDNLNVKKPVIFKKLPATAIKVENYNS